MVTSSRNRPKTSDVSEDISGIVHWVSAGLGEKDLRSRGKPWEPADMSFNSNDDVWYIVHIINDNDNNTNAS